MVADGLDRPVDVAVADDGSTCITDGGANRVLIAGDCRLATVCDLTRPEGLVALGERLLVLEVAARRLVQVDLASGELTVLCERLPIGDPPADRRQRRGIGDDGSARRASRAGSPD